LLAIRLMRTGAKKRPSYRIVVKEKRAKRDGAYIENVGIYNPLNMEQDRLDLERVRYWIEKGAQPTRIVERLVKRHAKIRAQEAQAGQETPAA